MPVVAKQADMEGNNEDGRNRERGMLLYWSSSPTMRY